MSEVKCILCNKDSIHISIYSRDEFIGKACSSCGRLVEIGTNVAKPQTQLYAIRSKATKRYVNYLEDSWFVSDKPLSLYETYDEAMTIIKERKPVFCVSEVEIVLLSITVEVVKDA